MKLPGLFAGIALKYYTISNNNINIKYKYK